MTTEVALHAEPIAGPSTGMRWVLPEVRLPVGLLLRAPKALGELIASGTIRDPWCEPHALRLRLRPDLSWREYGAPVRTAIREAVTDLDRWETDDDRAPVLRAIVEEVLAGPVGDYIASHGGVVEVKDVSEDTVRVAFGGACGHCPASGQTLQQQVEAAVRQRYPDLRHIVDAQCVDRRRPNPLFWPRSRARRPVKQPQRQQ